ncbi:DDE-domain-containing protein [Choiromyces venosus 120613-1]|uniref:DDE-domain-containing protein n=1 Tax=Choiromyces venosus 120613-1 TaxID=1336337 RepID=A0A3N4J8J7_9PEZI|nr:DDE-domain-containing protein [Choiromyces venosus 120613-1]
MAAEIVKTVPGKNWVAKFIEHHPDLKIVRAAALENDRQIVPLESIEKFFNRLVQVLDRYDIQSYNIWNMDESGLAIGDSSRITNLAWFVMVSHDIQLYVISATRLVTCIECILTPTGKSIPPLFITKGTVFPKSILPGYEQLVEGFKFYLARTDNGFATQATGHEWLRKVFLPYSKPPDVEGRMPWRILILDGHASHKGQQFFELCYFNKVIPIWLLPHSSHLLQPLDLLTFGVLKQSFHDKLYRHMSRGVLKIRFQLFFKIYEEARIVPLNIAVVLEAAAPSDDDDDNSLPRNPLQLVQPEHAKVGQRLDAAEARDHTRQATLNRVETQLEDQFLSYRAAARARGVLRSSPPSSPITCEADTIGGVHYDVPLF